MNSKKEGSLKVAVIIHPIRYWRGAEMHTKLVADSFDNSTIYTAWCNREVVNDKLPGYRVRTSFMQFLPFKNALQHEYVNLQPLAYWLFNFRKYDVVISVSDGFDKVIRKPKGVMYIINVLTVPRFLWLSTRTTRDSKKWTYWIYKVFFKSWIHKVWRWIDYTSAQKADYLISISSVVRDRVKRYWDRHSDVINPAVNLKQIEFNPDVSSREDWYVYFGGVNIYKGVELAIRACIQLNRKLRVYGDGEDRERLERLTQDLGGNNLISFYGWFEDEDKAEFLKSAKAAIIPTKDEDFGITYVESLAAGTPLIAFKGGGATDVLSEGSNTGVFFTEYSTNGLVNAIKELDNMQVDPQACRERALEFKEELFKQRTKEAVYGTLKG